MDSAFSLISTLRKAIAHHPRLKTGDLLDLLSDISPRLFLAGMVALLTFRVTQPMTFRAETGDTSVFTLTPNPDWLESMKVAQAESSGIGGGPPGEQWTNRPALVFAWLNMVLWGMGLPLGLAAWVGFAWAAWRALQDDQSWKAHLLPLTWAGGYFLFMGTRWVKSIRYFLPIYPFLILLAAWALVELWRRASTSDDGRQTTGDRPVAHDNLRGADYYQSISPLHPQPKQEPPHVA